MGSLSVGGKRSALETLKDAIWKTLVARMMSVSYLIRVLIGFAILTAIAYFVVTGWSSR